MSIHDLHVEEPERDFRGSWYARFSRVPATPADYAYVNIPDWGVDSEIGPCRWQQRYSTPHTPDVGDEALVMFDNRGNAWIPVWWPS